MKALKRLRNNPVAMRRLNGWLTIFWILMVPISIGLGWVNSVVYVSALSLWALVSGHWSAWEAARVEVKQDEDDQKREAGRRSLSPVRVRPGRALRQRSRAAQVVPTPAHRADTPSRS